MAKTLPGHQPVCSDRAVPVFVCYYHYRTIAGELLTNSAPDT